MTFKKFYNDFGYGLPMSVVKAAFGYVQQGHDVEPALGTAKILYAAKLERQPLCHTGYVRIVGEKRLQVYKVQTASLSGLNRLAPYVLQESRSETIIRLGENCAYVVEATFNNQPGVIFGSYEHGAKYVAVVRLNYGKNVVLHEGLLSRLQGMADDVAKNALAWWPEYLKKREALRKFYLEKYKREPQHFESSKTDFLNGQILRFAPFINDGYETGSSFYGDDKWITVSEYLANFKKLTGFEITIDGIDIYGLE